MGSMARPAWFLLVWVLIPSFTGSSARAARTADEAAAPLIGDNDDLASDAFDAVGSAALHLGTDFYEQLSYPFALAGRDRSKFLLGSAGIVALVLADRFTYQPMAHPSFIPGESLQGPARTLTNIGNARNAIPLVLGFGAAGLITGSHREKQTSVMLAEALVTSGIWTSLVKYASGRERPREMHEAVADWTGPGGAFADDDTRGGHGSFPSGHATGIWAAATVLAHQYPQGRVVPIAAYTTAAAISYSRMVVGAHFLSDVVVGGLIGYGCARQVIGAHERSQGPSRIHLLYEPTADEQRVGLTMDF
jgi:membrane-associated phospholipid phosphatase